MFSTGFTFQNVPAGAPAPAFSYLLDQITGSPGYFGAYSLRKLRSAYTGYVIKIRRASDNTELDIGFVNNVVDTASIASFCSGTTGYVKTWYDQSPGGYYNFTQTSNSQQPYIYQSGAVTTLDGKPCIYFDKDADQYLLSPSGYLYDIDTLSYYHVGAVDNFAGSNAGVFGPYDTYLQGFELLLHNVINVPTLLRLNASDYTNSSTADLFGDDVKTICEIYLNFTATAYNNNTSVTLSNGFWFNDQLNYNGLYRMSGYGGGAATSRMYEWVLFDTDLTAQRSTIYSNMNTYYF
jgi:hypothetical protein